MRWPSRAEHGGFCSRRIQRLATLYFRHLKSQAFLHAVQAPCPAAVAPFWHGAGRLARAAPLRSRRSIRRRRSALSTPRPRAGTRRCARRRSAKLTDGESLRMLAGLCAGTPSGRRPRASSEPRRSVSRSSSMRGPSISRRCVRRPSMSPPSSPWRAIRATPSGCRARSPRSMTAERRALVLGGPSSRIRQLAAQSVSDPAELRQLLKQLHGKDKNVYKIIREKCDALNAEEQRIEKARSEAVRACESLERHAHRIYEAIYEPTLRHFHTRWQALAAHAAPASARARGSRAIERCEEIIAEHHRRLAQEAAEAAARAAREAERAEAARLAELESARAARRSCTRRRGERRRCARLKRPRVPRQRRRRRRRCARSTH